MTRLAPLDRFTAKVDKTGDCWLWMGPLDRYGYGKFSVGSLTVIAHRWGYQQLVGPIPEGLTLDHLCHTRNLQLCISAGGDCQHRRCVNPSHLEPVTAVANVARGAAWIRDECPHGHEYTAENTWFDGRGYRNCRTCRRKRGAEWSRKARLRVRST